MNNSNNATKSLWELSSLRWSVIPLTIIAVVIATTIICNDNLVSNWGHEGWNNLLIIFKVPLGILALIITTIAVIAYNHRSVQTKELIKVQSQQNKFSNYYKHKEEFHKYLETALTNINKNVKHKYNIHSILFHDSNNKLDPAKIKLIEELIEHVISKLNNYSVKSSDENIKIIFSIDRSLQNVETMIGLDGNGANTNNGNNRTFKSAGVEFIIRGGHLRGHLNSVKSRIENIKTIFEFDQFAVLPDNFNKILGLDFISVPDRIDFNTLKVANGFNMSEILKKNNVLFEEKSK